jgi:tRNA pseudouridine32 synthase / 23S rRNA pseudouridine746 synthase
VSRWAQIRDGAVLYEDSAVLVLNKPAGLAVMGERHDTDLVRLAEDAGEKLYPAHRIDKVTSGALLLAKDLSLHGDLTRQFNRRTVDKVYLAMTRSTGLPPRGEVELPLSVGRKNRVRVAANRGEIVFDASRSRWSVPPDEEFQGVRTYPSLTTFCRVGGDERHTLLAVQPVTGRRHQIRVHLAWIGHPIEGDPLFDRGGSGPDASGPDASGGPGAGRTLLHSWRLGFDAAWAGGTRIRVEAPPGADFWAALTSGPAPLPDWDAAREALQASESGPVI